MSEIVERGHSAWRQLNGEWRHVQAQWHGVMYERFAVQFWDQLDDETRAFLRTLDELVDTLEEVQHLTNN